MTAPKRRAARLWKKTMYLKSLEMCGFKSFADRTKLVFEPGLIAIVGPNGCGKSNVSDAIRWVLGEQRASALRGSKMLDVIFNGTDTRKQMGMCEVSITFADCDGLLDTEFNEVTITRRVFRTGDSGYFINKTPCRLKDIQRLFMGTGIGTASYSVMAQGQIDAILSSRPEDRRSIFEEAAGVTKYKADRREALRKLDQTEANLLRIADVIRELKRQIASLQRQAAKAERFKTLKTELRHLDIFTLRLDIAVFDEKINRTVGELNAVCERENEAMKGAMLLEEESASLRAVLSENEDAVNCATEEVAQNEGKLEHSKELIKIGEQRILDYRTWADRDNKEIVEMRDQLTDLGEKIAALGKETKRLEMELLAASEDREVIERRTEEERLAIETLRKKIQTRRNESLERERRTIWLQNRLLAIDEKKRVSDIQKERLKGEYDKLNNDKALLRENREILDGVLDTLEDKKATALETYAAIEETLRKTENLIETGNEEVAAKGREIAGVTAKLDLLRKQEESLEAFESGAKLLLDKDNPLDLPHGTILGTFAEIFSVEEPYRTPVEAALRGIVDAVMVDCAKSCKEVLAKLSDLSKPSRLISMASDGTGTPSPEIARLRPLKDFVKVTPGHEDRVCEILSGRYLAETLADIPATLPSGAIVVTRKGEIVTGMGTMELCEKSYSPLSRKLEIEDLELLLKSLEEHLEVLKLDLEDAAEERKALERRLSAAKLLLDEAQRNLFQKQGEATSLCEDAKRNQERIDVVSVELDDMVKRTREADEEKEEIKQELEDLVSTRDDFLSELTTLQEDLKEREDDFSDFNRTLIDAKLREGNRRQELQQNKSQIDIFDSRIGELRRSLESRSRGIETYDENIISLTRQINETRSQILPLEKGLEESRTKLDTLKLFRAEKNLDLQKVENRLTELRIGVEKIRASHNALEIEKTELTMRRQNRIEQVEREYSLSAGEIDTIELPPFENGDPTYDTAKERIEWLNKAIEELGPVNLVAIEEYKELEERYEQESTQEEDLKKAKEELMNLIRMINQKSAEMFRATFEEANKNFEKMFTKLFNGGTAKLVIVENDEDPLECGVEIIARPPGKRLQSISLLSGGERTMTAVSLLFAIYLIKPSPFCLLDELDAALDDSNIGRFVQALKDFLVQSQFLIITHNQHSIANSGIVYGVTMPEKGVSKIVSMRLPEVGA